MSQSRRASLVETCTNIAIGFALSLGLQTLLMHAYGLHTSIGTDLQITVWFTVLSLVRGYVLRRVFNRIDSRGAAA